MRLWSIHPSYLDRQGLVALWREGLLAQKVLKGETRGYRHHPQLARFQEMDDPLAAIAYYLHKVCDEAKGRGYHFLREKILCFETPLTLPVTRGQLDYEWQHYLKKIAKRDPLRYADLRDMRTAQPHPLFIVTEGPVADWEKGSG